MSGKYRLRLTILQIGCVTLILILIFRVGYIQLFRGDYLTGLADDLHYRERTLYAKRGDILDRNGTVLATSASVCSISVIHNQVEDVEAVARLLSQELSMEYEEVLALVEKKVALQTIKTRVAPEVAERIREAGLAGIQIDENFKRYYPFGSLASQTIGFAGSDSQGIIGLEVTYNEYLQGINGSLLTLTDAKGIRLSGSEELRKEATEGNVLQTSLDVVVQQYAEQLLERTIEQKNAKRGAIIVMNPQNGEIYAMAIKPDFDLNDPFTINDETLAAQWDSMDSESQIEALNQMWRNFCINDTYEPGSTFKIITSAAALSEKVVSLDETFQCNGGLTVADRRIRCHKTGGHGTETFVQGVQNSCNPVFMTLALRLGADTFYKYLKAFEFDKKTGIDISGEAVGIMYDVEDVGPVELATMGFGQSIAITPMQLLRAAAAAVNGGNLITPHFGTQVLDQEGNVLKTLEFPVTEGVIDPEVSQTLRQVLETVVSEGGGSKAAITGYSIGGKTATSQKLPRSAKKYISSFLCFTPVEDAQLMTLMLIDEPEGIYYGGTVCAPVVKELLENILPYLGIEPDYTEEEALLPEVAQTEVPDLQGMTLAQARETAGETELDVLGEGEQIIEQFPLPGETVNMDSKIVVYLG
ncbi:MAG TPA: PASTA domain-containing protein [Candidatus Faecimorpha stercoravium]|nr:PASTA domain-containing protein [Candidatus Faecimorpha stercoravium]